MWMTGVEWMEPVNTTKPDGVLRTFAGVSMERLHVAAGLYPDAPVARGGGKARPRRAAERGVRTKRVTGDDGATSLGRLAHGGAGWSAHDERNAAPVIEPDGESDMGDAARTGPLEGG